MDGEPGAGRVGVKPSLDGVRREYRPVRSRWRGWWVWVQAICILLLARGELASHDRFGIACTGLVIAGALMQVLIIRRQRTVLQADGVREHSGVWRARFTSWSDIAAIHVPTRWDPTGRLVRRSGRPVHLPGAREGELSALAAQLQLPVPAEPLPGDQRLTGDRDLDGPFRSGVVRVSRQDRRPWS